LKPRQWKPNNIFYSLINKWRRFKRKVIKRLSATQKERNLTSFAGDYLSELIEWHLDNSFRSANLAENNDEINKCIGC
jgi:hypothetical protein